MTETCTLRVFAPFSAAALLVSVGCTEAHDCGRDHIVGSENALAVAGSWSLPDDLVPVSAQQYVEYESAPAWDNGANCGANLLAGSQTLKEYVSDHFDGVRSIGGFNCRQNTANAAKTSVHGTGRALDIMIPTLGGEADNDVGDVIANWLVVNAEHIGIQYIVWDRSSWSGAREGNKIKAYGGPHPHHDHLHVELTHAAAAETTAWFSEGGFELPPIYRPYAARLAQQDESMSNGEQVVGTAGEIVTMSFAFMNYGTESWIPGETQLAVVAPERDSFAPAVYVPSWLSETRLGTVEDVTAPGEVGEFVFDVHVPMDGFENVYVGLVHDNGLDESWFPGFGGPEAHGLFFVAGSSTGGSSQGASFADPIEGPADSGGLEGGCSVQGAATPPWVGVLMLLGLLARRRL